MSEGEIISAEIADDLVGSKRPSIFKSGSKKMTAAVILTLIFISSTTLYFFLEEESVNYGKSMTFDQERTRSFAEDLVNLGHPEWISRGTSYSRVYC